MRNETKDRRNSLNATLGVGKFKKALIATGICLDILSSCSLQNVVMVTAIYLVLKDGGWCPADTDSVAARVEVVVTLKCKPA